MRKFLLLGTALLLSWQVSAQVVKQDPTSFPLNAAVTTSNQLPNNVAPGSEGSPEYWPDRVFIKFRSQATTLQTYETPANMPARLALDKVNRSLQRYATQRVSKLPGSSKLPSFKNTYEVVIDKPGELNKLLQEFKAMSEVEYVERVPYYVTHEIINDPEFVGNNQYAMKKIQAAEAFGIHRGTSKTLIAIVDDAALVTHPDLAANIDIARSYDVADRDNDPRPPSSGINKAGPNTFSHGTHCAGIAGAVTNNNVGISSVSNNKISIIGVKCTSDETANSRSIERSVEGILHAINQGARVISMSFGGGGKSQTLQSIINEAAANGVVFIASAGNSNVETIQYPAGYDNVIAVASSDDKDLKSSFSNYGTWVDVIAPGSGILSTVTGADGTSGSYIVYSGTSMSTPMVAGMVALMLSENPNLSAQAVEEIIKNTADDIYHTVGQSPLHANKLGAGRINAFKAIQAIQSLAPAAAPSAITDLAIDFATMTDVKLTWSAPSLNATDKATLYDIRYATAPITSDNFEAATRATASIKPDVLGTAQQVVVRNLEPNTTYYFAIVARSFYGDGSAVSNIVTTRTLDAARLQTDAAPLAIAINRDELPVATENIMLRNIGALPLHYSISINPKTGSNILTNAKAKANSDGRVGFGTSSFTTATKFVAGPKGFKLTHVQNFIHNSTTINGASIGVKIIKGGANPKEGTLLTSQTTSKKITAGGEILTLPLQEPQEFEPGEVFWIAFVLPSGLDFPQGYDNVGPSPETFFISSDNGNKYEDAQKMADFLNSAAFKIQAVQANWLSLTPVLDVIQSNDTQNLTFTIDTDNIVNGTYVADLLFTSDDPITPSIKKSVSITIDGGKPKVSATNAALDFGSLFVGASNTQKIRIANTGVAALNLTSPTFSTGNTPSANFTFTPALPLTVLPGTEQEISVKFTPAAKQALAGTVKLATNDPDASELTINLSGAMLNPPVAAVSPASLNITVNKLESPSATETIKLHNTGEAAMDYNLQLQLDATETIRYDLEAASSNHIGFDNANTPFSSAIKFDVTTPAFSLTGVENYYRNLTFGEKELEIKIYKGGETPTGGKLLLEQTFKSKLETNTPGAATFQLKEALNFVKNDVFWVIIGYSGMPTPQGVNAVVPDAGRNYYSQNGTTWTEYTTNTFKIRALGVTTMWLSATPVAGSLAPGEKNVSALVDASNLKAGNYSGRILVSTNDPAAPEKIVSIALKVNESTVAGMEDESDAASFYVYPNPTATGKVKIALTLEKKSDVSVRMYNLSGQAILNNTSRNKFGAYEEELNVKGVPAGLYLVQVQYDNKVLTRRVLVM